MTQPGYIVGAALLAFLIYLAARGRLSAYAAVIGL